MPLHISMRGWIWRGLELHQDGESYPNDYFESPHYDFISRCDGDEWPE
ncbi:DUF6547 family protein [Actinotignum urinale]